MKYQLSNHGKLGRKAMESQRLAAAADLRAGISQAKVAIKYGVSRTTASRWNRALKYSGLDGLRARRSPGRPRQVDRSLFRRVFRDGPRKYGFRSWTGANLASAIERESGVLYDHNHVLRVMHELDLWTPQRRASLRWAHTSTK